MKQTKNENLEIMQNFTEKNLPNLDTCVLGALELFSEEKIPEIKISHKKPLVVGSGNAEATGKIIFSDKEPIFANENNLENKLENIKDIDGVVIVSASGGKHAPKIAHKAKSKKKKVTLITNNQNAKAKRFANKTFVFPKQREPYTYNTSTYMGMILGKTNENPKEIHRFLRKRIDEMDLKKLKNYEKFYLIIPPEFSKIKRMLQVKFIELFGRKIARDVETSEYIKHATTVVPSKELFITFGDKQNKTYGKPENRIQIPLPKDSDYGSMMAVGYYIIGKIQKTKPPWFKQNIKKYTEEASKTFGENIEVIVE